MVTPPVSSPTERLYSFYIEVEDLRNRLQTNYYFFLPSKKVAFLFYQASSKDKNVYQIHVCACKILDKEKTFHALIGAELMQKYFSIDVGPYQMPRGHKISSALAEKIQKAVCDSTVFEKKDSTEKDIDDSIEKEFFEFASTNKIRLFDTL